MKRELTTHSPLPDKPFDVSDLDPILARAMEKNPALTGFGDEEREKARERLKAMEPILVPITKSELRDWVVPIVVACMAPKVEVDVKAWLDALHLAMADVPRGLFTVTKQRWALRQMKFFPTPADIWEAIKDDWVELTDHVRALRMIAGEP